MHQVEKVGKARKGFFYARLTDNMTMIEDHENSYTKRLQRFLER